MATCTSSATPNWTTSLDARGLYYEGLVEDIDTLLEKHKLGTVTTYGTRRSRRPAQSTTITSPDENTSEQIQNKEEKIRREDDNVSNILLLIIMN